MSLEFSVLSDRRLSSTAEWQQAIDAEGFPLRLDPECALPETNGFFPAHFGDKLTGFECFHDDAAEMIANYPDIDFGAVGPMRSACASSETTMSCAQPSWPLRPTPAPLAA